MSNPTHAQQQEGGLFFCSREQEPPAVSTSLSTRGADDDSMGTPVGTVKNALKR